VIQRSCARRAPARTSHHRTEDYYQNPYENHPAFGLGILFLDEVRKWAVRNWPMGLLAKLAW
jgi:hypothetical protein